MTGSSRSCPRNNNGARKLGDGHREVQYQDPIHRNDVAAAGGACQGICAEVEQQYGQRDETPNPIALNGQADAKCHRCQVEEEHRSGGRAHSSVPTRPPEILSVLDDRANGEQFRRGGEYERGGNEIVQEVIHHENRAGIRRRSDHERGWGLSRGDGRQSGLGESGGIHGRSSRGGRQAGPLYERGIQWRSTGDSGRSRRYYSQRTGKALINDVADTFTILCQERTRTRPQREPWEHSQQEGRRDQSCRHRAPSEVRTVDPYGESARLQQPATARAGVATRSGRETAGGDEARESLPGCLQPSEHEQ